MLVVLEHARAGHTRTIRRYRVVIGLIDDDASLHNRWIYGYKVLGASGDLPKLIASNGLSGIIIVDHLKSEALKALEKMATEHGIQLSEWRFEERTIELPADAPQAYHTTH